MTTPMQPFFLERILKSLAIGLIWAAEAEHRKNRDAGASGFRSHAGAWERSRWRAYAEEGGFFTPGRCNERRLRVFFS